MKYVDNNYAVVRAFLDGFAAKTSQGNFRSTGTELWSYQMKIAERLNTATPIILHIPKSASPSTTTSRHIGLLLREAPPRWLIPSPDLTLSGAHSWLINQPREGTIPALIELVEQELSYG